MFKKFFSRNTDRMIEFAVRHPRALLVVAIIIAWILSARDGAKERS